MAVEVKYIESRERWTIWVDGVFLKYTEASMSQKASFISSVQGQITSMGGAADVMANLFSVYWDRAYNSTGADEITQEDLEPYGLQLVDFTACITLIENFGKFLDNQAAAVADYDSTINKVRSDM